MKLAALEIEVAVAVEIAMANRSRSRRRTSKIPFSFTLGFPSFSPSTIANGLIPFSSSSSLSLWSNQTEPPPSPLLPSPPRAISNREQQPPWLPLETTAAMKSFPISGEIPLQHHLLPEREVLENVFIITDIYPLFHLS